MNETVEQILKELDLEIYAWLENYHDPDYLGGCSDHIESFHQLTMRLWNERNSQPDDWIQILNMIQLCTAEIEDEDFDEKKILFLKWISEDLLRRECKLKDLEEMIAKMREVDIDPWEPISFREEDQHE